MKDERGETQTISKIDITIALQLTVDFNKAYQSEMQFTLELRENGMDHVVDGLNNQQESTS